MMKEEKKKKEERLLGKVDKRAEKGEERES